MYISDEFRAEHSLAYSVYGMQLASFENAGLDTTFPFNTAKSFEQECKEKRCMFNEKRVQWVKDRVKQLEQELDFFYDEAE
jgi:hypothetical protein